MAGRAISTEEVPGGAVDSRQRNAFATEAILSELAQD